MCLGVNFSCFLNMFGILHVALLFALLAYHIQTTCPLTEPCAPEAGVTCEIVHKFAPQIVGVYNTVALKMPDPNDYAYFQELKKVSNDFLGIREKSAAKEPAEVENDTFATSPSDETIESEGHVHEEKATPENEEISSESSSEILEVPVETGASEEEPVASSENSPSKEQKIAEKVEELVEEVAAAEAIELAAEVGANL